MKIIDPRKDYYDCIQGFGQDAYIKYIRIPKTIENIIDSPKIYINPLFPHLIGFCGQLYPCVEFHKIEYSSDYTVKTETREFIYNFDDARKFFNNERSIQYLMRFFDLNNYGVNYYTFFHEYKTPIFSIYFDSRNHKQDLIINPLLKNYHFAKIVDPYTAFNKIESYISGVLGSTAKPIPEISDEIKRDIHGFDKWSFKTKKNVKPNRKKK